MIHGDLWGLYGNETIHGYRFFLTIVDDHSRNVCNYFLPSKQQGFAQLKIFLTYVENLFKSSVKQVCSDHGIEFFKNSFLTLILDKGIVDQASCVATPAQNGRVERKHRQLLAISHFLCFESGLPIRYWGECI